MSMLIDPARGCDRVGGDAEGETNFVEKKRWHRPTVISPTLPASETEKPYTPFDSCGNLPCVGPS